MPSAVPWPAQVDYARCWRVIVDPGDGRPASGLAVSRSFGDPDFKEPLHLVTATPDVMQERLLPGDTFVVLASDGLVRRGAREGMHRDSCLHLWRSSVAVADMACFV